MIAIQVYEDATEAVMLADWTGRVRRGLVETDEHGFAVCSGVVPMTLDASFYWYDLAPVKHIVVSSAGFRLFEGRIEDRAITDEGLEFAAFGYWRALSDGLYTALWSTTRYDTLSIANEENVSVYTPSKYSLDNNNRLYMALRKGETYVTGTNEVGGWFYIVPNNSYREYISEVELDYDVNLPTNWQFQIVSYDTGWTGAVAELTVTTSDTQTNQFILLTANKEIVAFRIRNNTGSDYTCTAESDAYYAKVTNIRIKSTGANTIEADRIVDDLVAFTSGLNSSQLSSSTNQVETATADLTDELYEDVRPASIIVDLATRCDTGGERWEAGVWENQELFFRPRGSKGLTWYADIESLNLNSTVDAMYNRVYAIYRDENGRTQRTADADDTDRQAIYGLVRMSAVNADTTSSTTAAYKRDVALAEQKYMTPQARIVLAGLFSSAGGLAMPWLARAGDTVVIRNLPPTAGEEIDRIRTFVISRTSYDLDTGIMTLAPEIDPPGLEYIVANVGLPGAIWAPPGQWQYTGPLYGGGIR